MTKLEGWAVQMDMTNPYRAPEQRRLGLTGIVTGHPELEDGAFITTTHPVWLDLNKNMAKTKSGTLYHLGKPDPNWLKWMAESGHKLMDYHNPEQKPVEDNSSDNYFDTFVDGRGY